MQSLPTTTIKNDTKNIKENAIGYSFSPTI